jgi:hypothetical protein
LKFSRLFFSFSVPWCAFVAFEFFLVLFTALQFHQFPAISQAGFVVNAALSG